jgi:hypothetical protein
MVAHLRGGLTDIAVKGRIVLHKMGCRQTHLGTIEQHLNMLLTAMLASRLSALLGGVHTDTVAVQRILNTLLYLNLTHRLTCILLHLLLTFFL